MQKDYQAELSEINKKIPVNPILEELRKQLSIEVRTYSCVKCSAFKWVPAFEGVYVECSNCGHSVKLTWRL